MLLQKSCLNKSNQPHIFMQSLMHCLVQKPKHRVLWCEDNQLYQLCFPSFLSFLLTSKFFKLCFASFRPVKYTIKLPHQVRVRVDVHQLLKLWINFKSSFLGTFNRNKVKNWFTKCIGLQWLQFKMVYSELKK